MKTPRHFTIRNQFKWFLCFLLLMVPPIASARQVTLAWDPNTESDLAGYNLFHRLAGQSYDYNLPVWTGSDNLCTIDIVEPGTHYFVVTAFTIAGIESGNSNEASLTMTTNAPPKADAGLDQTVYEGVLVTLDASRSSDPDDGIAYYLWSQTTGTKVVLSDLSKLKPTFTAPQVGADEGLNFKLTVTDRSGVSNSDNVLITVKNMIVNQPPTANAGLDQTVDEKSVVSLDGSKSTDPDGTIVSYKWSQTAGPSVQLSNPSAVGPLFTSPDVNSTGANLTFQLIVTDNKGATASDNINVLVNDITAPTTVSLAITNIRTASVKNYQVGRNLANGSTCYIDRWYLYKNVPEFLKGATFIKTARRDNRRTDNPFISFQVNRPVTVYVAFDNRAALPSWMMSFKDTGFDLITDVPLSIYEKSFPAGFVSLGGNGHRGSMYTVIIREN